MRHRSAAQGGGPWSVAEVLRADGRTKSTQYQAGPFIGASLEEGGPAREWEGEDDEEEADLGGGLRRGRGRMLCGGLGREVVVVVLMLIINLYGLGVSRRTTRVVSRMHWSI